MFPLFLVTVQVGPVFPSKSICGICCFQPYCTPGSEQSSCVVNQSVWAGFGHEPYRHNSKSWSPFRALVLMRKGLIDSFWLKHLSSAEWATYCIKGFFIMCGDLSSHFILHYLHDRPDFSVAFFGHQRSPQWNCSCHEALIYVWIRETLEDSEFGLAETSYRPTFFLSSPFLWWTLFCLDGESVLFIAMDAIQRRKRPQVMYLLRRLCFFVYLI